MLLQDVMERIEHARVLDRPAAAVRRTVDPVTRPEPVKKFLSGTWLGHRLHPLMIVLPLGAWTSALALDAARAERLHDAADRLVGLGVLSALPTAAAGASDWADTDGAARRVGLLHAAANWTALAAFGSSWVARRRGRRKLGVALSLAGAGAVGVGGYLGGHMSYVQAVGVDNRAFTRLPEEWTPVLRAEELTEGALVKAETGATPVVLYLRDGEVSALSDRCVHAGGPLHEGEVRDGCVTCPWHGSTFDLTDGSVVRAPASSPQPVLATRLRDGWVEVRAEPPGR